MAQTKAQIQAILGAAGAAPLHRFGQNFMIDQNLVRVVAGAGEIQSTDRIIEIGPGTGTLTEELLASPAAKVLAVEIDRNLAGMLREKFAAEARFELVEGDALSTKHQLNGELLKFIDADADGTTKLIANLPYNIAAPLIIEMLQAGVDRLVFTVQKEVADRLAARADSDAYGTLTVMTQLLSNVEVLRTLPKQAFWPMPMIESALVRLTRNDQLGPEAVAFGQFVKKLFSSRRKTLRKALAVAGLPADEMLQRGKVDGQRRAEEFSPGELLDLFHAIP